MLFCNKPVVFDLDDFCEEIMTPVLWDNLFRLKDHYPNLKATMFTIPLKCSEDWLAMIKEEYEWIEMHYHGSDHTDRNEWFDKMDIELPYDGYFYKGFKAPWWRMNQKTADVLDEKGFLISTMRGHFDIRGSRIYRFNLGQERIKGIWYESLGHHSFHSHVQEQRLKVGLPDADVFDRAMSAFHKNSKFMFISELL